MKKLPLMMWCLAAINAHAHDGASFLTIPAFARESSLGVGVMSRGAQALFYNPAGAAVGARYNLSATHAQYLESSSLDALAVSAPTPLGRLGLSVLSLAQKSIGGRDEQGRPADSFGASDMAIGLSWARPLAGLQAGVTLKMVRQELAGYTATGQAIDLGLQSAVPVIQGLNAGLSVTNLGPAMKFISEDYQLPLSFNAGAQLALGSPFLVQAGVSHRPHANVTSAAVGAELRLASSFALRSSVTNMISSEGPKASLLGQLGYGIGWSPRNKSFSVDYAMLPVANDLGTTHRLSFSLEWGSANSRSRRDGGSNGAEMLYNAVEL